MISTRDCLTGESQIPLVIEIAIGGKTYVILYVNTDDGNHFDIWTTMPYDHVS